MKFRISIRFLRISFLLTILAAVFSIPLANVWILRDTRQNVYSDTGTIPHQRVGLVLGCGRNIYFYYRIEAAERLYKAGKIDHILVSGGNRTAAFDEAGAMKEALIQRGIPSQRITCDYAGFSTIDSIIRANKIFGQNRLTIVSQEFHVRRALFIAKRHHVDAIGYCAPDVEKSIGAPTQMREAFARVKTVLDLYILKRKPLFLGEPVQIIVQPNPLSPISPDKA